MHERIFVEEVRANTQDKVAYIRLSGLLKLVEGRTKKMTATPEKVTVVVSECINAQVT